ncbi:MAG TPA: basic amino acid ABC transporter substrate-binding protein [Desulfomonilia bacterium]|nr:basic amino acid ABC transporter substrate-binding protein [Deltaproteobacteria bacterium]HRS56115.1 basic amino acid ABC transporter substrate-binding protein [Desulfomonilia bacterium]HRV35767.1 basic amino acid ABC transporter substrate-binding protein [Desulfomonilia bacterium]
MKTLNYFLAFIVVIGLVAGMTSCQQKQEEPKQAAQEQATSEQAAPMKTLVVATDATWPPMEMVDKDKNIVGFDIDFMKAVAEEAGFKVEFKNTAWDGIFGGLDLGNYDAVISSVTITDERKQNFDFSLPYINAGQVLTVPKDLEGVTSLAEMTGKMVGAQIGTTGAMEVKKAEGVEAKNYDEIGLAFEDMASGRIQGVVCDTPVAADYALQRDEYKDKFKIVGEPFTQESYGIVVKKGNQEVLDLINKGIQAVQAKGIDKELEDKWLR